MTMPELHDLLERRASGYEPSHDLFERVLDRRRRRDRTRRVGTAVVALAVAAIAIGGLLRNFASGTVPAGDSRAPFLGTWVATDADGSTPTMTVGASGDGAVEIEVHDDLASVCADGPSTMTGTGKIRSDTELVVPSPAFVCDDGSEPEAVSGPPPEEELRDLTFVHDPATDALIDTFGVVWVRLEGDPNLEPSTPAGTWPQASLQEIRQAQGHADAGDPAFTWQVDPELADGSGLGEAEIFSRFLREELGWDAFIQNPFVGLNEFNQLPYNMSVRGIAFIRCAPGETNPLYPDDPRAGTCAPTLDGRFETVSIDVAQLGLRGPSGVWVVTGWRTLPPFQQLTPPSDAEVAELLDGFLAARVAGAGAGRYLDVSEGDIPLMYATSAGAPYERSEFERLRGPSWPDGELVVEVRLFALFAEGGETVVEQVFVLRRADDGRIEFEYLADGPDVAGTTENGQAVSEPYRILDGEVTFGATRPWRPDYTGWLGDDLLLDGNSHERVEVEADPRPSGTGCHDGPASADAAALARTIRSDPDLDVTAPVATRVGGVEALRMDVVAAPGARVCDGWIAGSPVVTETSVEPGSRMRLYLLDLPGGSARILAVAIVAPEPRFEQVAEAAAHIVDSFEFGIG
jgi:hypothetical protein